MRLKTLSYFSIFLKILAIALIIIEPAMAQTYDTEENVIVEADQSLQWQRVDKKYIATGNATAQQGDTLLSADVITATYIDKNGGGNDPHATNITLIEGKADSRLTPTSRLTPNSRLTQGAVIATAETITYDLTTEQATLRGRTPSISTMDNTLTARDSITYHRKSRTVTATGKAEAVMADGRIVRGDIIIATLNEREDDVETITANANTELHNPNVSGVTEAFADSMVYRNETGIAVLSGGVTIKDGDNIITGQKAEIDTISGLSTISASPSGKRVDGIFIPAE
jgi:lipopolysaccharide export system protein LptA